MDSAFGSPQACEQCIAALAGAAFTKERSKIFFGRVWHFGKTLERQFWARYGSMEAQRMLPKCAVQKCKQPGDG
ncbi:hypothetical protein NXC24_PB00355 (plasmid) [Rhizobium sp. NXC24]|nr:hypothetical protein NXC24_PB00355 [Rhizobium sp. NXC24]